jgi:hypothetical protein
MDHTHPTAAPRRATRPVAALVAALLALTAGFVVATPAPGGAAEDPPTGLTWKMSEQAFTSSSLSPAHATAAPATKTDAGFSFPEVEAVSVNALSGAATATFPGSFDLGNTNQGNYRIRVEDPTVTLAAGRATGAVSATVSYALFDAGTQTHDWSTPVSAVVANLTVAPGTIVDTGSHLSFTVTPDFVLRTDLTPETNPNGFRQFPQPFLDALAPAQPSLLGHFRETNTGQPAKAPAPVTVSFPYMPEAPPTGLTWKVSQQAFTSSSLSPAHATAAPATKIADVGFSFPETSSAIYDPETGEGQIDFPGSFDLGNTNQGNYRIRIANPSLLLDGEDGDLVADVSYALPPAPEQPHGFTTPTRATVADLTFPDGSITVDGDQLSFLVTPDFVLRTDLTPENNPNGFRQFPQPFLDALAPAQPSLLGHFRETAVGQPAKAPTPLAVNVTFAEPDPDVVFVEAVYRTVLDRSPGEGELAYWVGRLDGGTSRTTVATSIVRSVEGRRRLVAIGYSSALDRSPGAAEIDYWAGRVAAGLTPESLLVQLLGSPEALAVWGGTHDGLAEGGYQVFLHRAGDAGGITYWGDRLEGATTTATRGAVLKAFGRTAAATRAAIAAAFANGCGTIPTQEPSETALFESVWAQSGHHPLLMIAAALVSSCPGGPQED